MKKSADTILLTTATMREAAPLVNLLRLRELKDVERTRVFSRNEVTLAITGIGADSTLEILRTLLGERKPSLVINAGLCAAINDQISVGSCLETGRVTGDCCDGKIFQLSSASRACTSIYSVTQPVEAGALLPENACSFDLLDMEACTHALICSEFGLPLRVFKVVSDIAGKGSRREIIKNTPALMAQLANFIQREIFS